MNFNPYQQIDERRKQTNAMGDFNPTFTLPQHIGQVWGDIKQMCAQAFVGKMQTGTRPPAPHIYAFNIMSSGDRPFTNEAFATLCTEVALIYAAALKQNGAQNHNANVANEIANGMVGLYSLAVVKGDQQLQSMCPPGDKQSVMNAAQEYEARVNQAQQVLSGNNGGWGNDSWGAGSNGNNGWSNGSNNNDGWGSNGNSGWGDQSWGSAAQEDITSSNAAGWDEGSHNNDWGDGNAFNTTTSWGDESMDTASSTTVASGWGEKEQVKQQVTLDETEAAIAALLGAGEPDESGETNTGDDGNEVGEVTSFDDLGFGDDEINWVAGDDDIMDWTEETPANADSDDADCPSIEELQEMNESYPEVELEEFFVAGFTLHPEALELSEVDVKDEKSYLAEAFHDFGDCRGILIPNKEGVHILALHETTVARDQQRFLTDFDPMLNMGIQLPIGNKVPVYLLNQDMEFVRTMITLEDHDIYNVEEESLAELTDLVAAAEPNTPHLAERLKGKVEYADLGAYHNISELFTDAEGIIEQYQSKKSIVIGNFTKLNSRINMPKDWAIPAAFTKLEDIIAFIDENDDEFPRLTRAVEKAYLGAYNNLVTRVCPEDDFTASSLNTVLDVIAVLEGGDLTEANINITNTRAKQLCNLIYSLARDLVFETTGDPLLGSRETYEIYTGIKMSALVVVDNSVQLLEELCGELTEGSYRIMADAIPADILERLQLDKLNGLVVTPDIMLRLTRINDDWLQLTIMETIS